MGIYKKELEKELEIYYSKLNIELEEYEKALIIEEDEGIYRQIDIQESYTYDVCFPMLLAGE